MSFLFTPSKRIGRCTYWVANVLALGLFLGVGAVLESINPDPDTATTLELWILFPTFGLVFWISLVTGIQRLHDRGKSGMWLLLGFIPVIGDLWLLIELGFLPGDRFRNLYGEPET